ncbi:MAG: DUF4199 domain-containing protein [Prevotellaceae bacterium]|jgi:hypothetical protein|nr:DUF4199 domain-containing protein [Prevotellaceae bacterium]
MKNSFIQNAVTYGLLIGLGLIILSLVDWQLGFYGQNVAFALLHYVVIIGGLVWSALAWRNQAGGFIAYSTLVGFGAVVVIASAVVACLFDLLLTQVIDPSYTERMLMVLEDSLISKGIAEKQIEMIVDTSRKFAAPAISTTISFFVSVLRGVVIALITSAFIQRKGDRRV